MEALAAKAVTAETPASQHKAEHTSAREAARTAAFAPLFSASLLQRKAACACGGHCPRCQQSSFKPNVSISQPEADHERQADDTAARVMRLPAPETKLKQQQLHAAHSTSTLSPVGAGLNSSGQPLNLETRAFFEPRFGRNFSDVRVHTDAGAARSAQAVGAQAYTLGREIVFNENQYRPQTEAGKGLLAHELAHVASHSEQHVLHRKPLPVEVPETGEDFNPDYKYPWQNPALRKTIYPYRDEALSFFLRTYMEIDLDDPAIPVTPVTVAELEKERARLSDELETLNNEFKAVDKEFKAAKKGGKGKTVDKDAMAALEARMTEIRARYQRLDRDLKYLPEPKKGKGKDKTVKLSNQKTADKKWTAYRYSKLDDTGQDAEHDVLLGRILDRFDADKDFTRYPKWLRYMVIHFSGMRYQTAHGSYAPATGLLKRLKREQLNYELGSAPESEVEERSEVAISELEEELAADKKPGRKRAKVIKPRLAALHAVDKVEEGAFSKKGQAPQREAFEKLTALEEERDHLKSQLYETDIGWEQVLLQEKLDRLKAIEPQIEALEDEIGSKSLKTVRRRIAAAEDRRRAAVIEHEIERADDEFSKLDDMQALSILKTMRTKGAFPEWVWHEIFRVTALKLEADEGSDWERLTKEERKEKQQKDPVTLRWKAIMKKWKGDVTGWRAKHGNDLSLVVVRAVCNEVCEMSQHARGVNPAGGISQKATWYSKGGASGRSFSRPMTEADLIPGSSLFFLEWSYKPAKDKVNIVRHDIGVELKNEKMETLSNGFKDAGEWTYYFNSDTTVTRVRPIGSTTDDQSFEVPWERQYLNWTHEAMVVEVDSKRGHVITFETGPIGLDKRTLDKVLNQWHVYMGFAPAGKEPADIDQYFKDVLPGR